MNTAVYFELQIDSGRITNSQTKSTVSGKGSLHVYFSLTYFTAEIHTLIVRLPGEVPTGLSGITRGSCSRGLRHMQ